MVKELLPIASALDIPFVPFRLLCEALCKMDDAFEAMTFYLAIVLPMMEIPAKEHEKHVTIAGYFIFARQEEEHGY